MGIFQMSSNALDLAGQGGKFNFGGPSQQMGGKFNFGGPSQQMGEKWWSSLEMEPRLPLPRINTSENGKQDSGARLTCQHFNSAQTGDGGHIPWGMGGGTYLGAWGGGHTLGHGGGILRAGHGMKSFVCLLHFDFGK